MGMYDTLRFECPNCKKKTDVQTKLSDEPMLNNYSIGSKTYLPDGIFRAKDACHNCDHVPTFVIAGGIFLAILKDPPEKAKQEGAWGSIEELGFDVNKQISDVAAALKEIFKDLKDE